MCTICTHTEIHRERVCFGPYSAPISKGADKQESLAPLCRKGNRGTGGLSDLLLVMGRVLAPGPGFRGEVLAVSGVFLSSLSFSSWPSRGPSGPGPRSGAGHEVRRPSQNPAPPTRTLDHTGRSGGENSDSRRNSQQGPRNSCS